MTRLEFVIAVVLDRSPQMVVVPKEASGFDISGDHFDDVGLGVLNGFYDFLRSGSGAIIGVRYLPYPDAEFVLNEVPLGDGLRVANEGSEGVLLIFWGDDQTFDPSTSSDQYFGDNTVYRSKRTGRLALSFGIDTLTAAERASFLPTEAM
jgi:hypothetical protein